MLWPNSHNTGNLPQNLDKHKNMHLADRLLLSKNKIHDKYVPNFFQSHMKNLKAPNSLYLSGEKWTSIHGL